MASAPHPSSSIGLQNVRKLLYRDSSGTVFPAMNVASVAIAAGTYRQYVQNSEADP